MDDRITYKLQELVSIISIKNIIVFIYKNFSILYVIK